MRELHADTGWAVDDMTREYMRRAVERIWRDDDDREALRAKAKAAASAEVDALFDAMGG